MANSLCPAFSTFTRRSPINFYKHPYSYPFLCTCSYTTQAYTQKTSPSNVLLSEAPTRPHSEILRIRESLLSREKTAVEITDDYLSRLKEREPKIKSFLYISEHALQEAEQLDKMIAAKAPLGPLSGVPFGVKDNLCSIDMPSTGGSKILENYRPPFDATSVRKMKEAGALALGKTNLDEFGMGSSTESSAFQVTTS
ncbi:hypothetical protein GOP47_0028427 [Adiantum capillus-veneris]|nr:hypothetical protein GOP47_0028427 [Adiantum capillus-veneris]